MKASADIEYHIEITSLRDFANKLLEQKTIPINSKGLLDDFIKAVINSELKPFLTKENSESGYYKKYITYENDLDFKTIPDFFSYEGDFYDLNILCNINRNNIEEDVFRRLFAFKLFELNNTDGKLSGFLDFQLYDNFYGQKEDFGMFLYRFVSNDSNSYGLPAIASEIQQWINKNKLAEMWRIMKSFLSEEAKCFSVCRCVSGR